jgi:hypothetical protein
LHSYAHVCSAQFALQDKQLSGLRGKTVRIRNIPILQAVAIMYGTLAECNVEALCSPSGNQSDNFYIYANAYSGLGCPTDTVENNAQGGWNQVDTINAWSQALDIYNGLQRGYSFSQESCTGTPLYYFSSDTTVCGQPPVTSDPPVDGGGGGGGTSPPVLCLYGDIDGDPSDGDIELCSGPPAPLQSVLRAPTSNVSVSESVSQPILSLSGSITEQFCFSILACRCSWKSVHDFHVAMNLAPNSDSYSPLISG